MLLTHKFYSDDFFENHFFAEISGVSLEEINFLELQFLGVIEFNLNVNEEEYDQYKAALAAFFSNEENNEAICHIGKIVEANIEGQMDKNDEALAQRYALFKAHIQDQIADNG